LTPTKLLVGQILIVFAIVFAGVWASTQWCAAQLGYQAQLGPAWFMAGDTPVYRPWAIFPWWYHYEAYALEIFDRAGMLAGSSGFLGCAAAIAGSLWRARQSRHVTTYGSARWATVREIERNGLFGDAGIFLGRKHGRYLRHDGPEHVMAFAPTRSGKGVGLVVPTLLSWTGSAIVHDIKGENWQLTAGWRSRFSHALLFNPTDPASARYNPLLEVRRGRHEVRDIQNIADILVDPEGALERRNHWEKTSHSLLVGAILHVLYAEEEKTLARVATFLSDPQRPFVATLRRMMTTNHLGTAEEPRVHPVVASAARELLNKSENERSGVLSTAMSFLGHYRDPTVAEVPALGRLDFFETSLAFMAGYGVRAFLVAQSLNQVEKAYGEHNSILDNCHVRVAFATNDERTARRVSDALGVATEQRAMRNYAGHRLAPWLAHVMVSRQETARPLLTQGEVMQLPPDDELVLVSGIAPIRAKKLRYYDDANFRARLAPPPALSDGHYKDRPAPRADDWSGLVRAPDDRLGHGNEPDAEDDGGLQQQRHPALDEHAVKAEPAKQLELPDLERDDPDAAADKRVMDRVRASLVRGHALNQSQTQDLLPGL
jgi:type IV secretion system protein VirD4